MNNKYQAFLKFTKASLCAMLFLLCDTAKAQLPFADGFETGSLSTQSWEVTGNAAISNQSPASGNFCVKGPSNWGILKRFNQSPANFVTIEFKTKASQTNTTSVVFRVMDSLVRTAGGMFFNNAGNIIGVDGSNSIIIMPYDTGRWYVFKFVMNMQSKTYDMYIDNNLKADDFNFSSPQFTTVNIFTWSSIAQSGIHWIDEIFIYPGSAGIAEQKEETNIRIYPNPVNDYLNLSLSGNDCYEAILINALGQKIWRYDNVQNHFQIDCSQMNKGIYYLKLTQSASGKTLVQKIIKQ